MLSDSRISHKHRKAKTELSCKHSEMLPCDREHPSFHKISYLTSGEAPGLPYEVLKWQLHLFIFHFL